jgi:hypothetical protein
MWFNKGQNHWATFFRRGYSGARNMYPALLKKFVYLQGLQVSDCNQSPTNFESGILKAGQGICMFCINITPP